MDQNVRHVRREYDLLRRKGGQGFHNGRIRGLELGGHSYPRPLSPVYVSVGEGQVSTKSHGWYPQDISSCAQLSRYQASSRTGYNTVVLQEYPPRAPL